MNKHRNVKIKDVKEYWNKNPLCASAIPYSLGTPEYFEYYDKLREANESLEFSYALHEYKDFAGKKVLDVGSGNGYVLSKYAKEGAKVFGIDITETGIDLCRRRFELLGLKGAFLIANAEELPFEDEAFNCVCSMGVLHHTPNPEKAIAEIYRVLKKNGRLIVMVYHRHSALYQIIFRLQHFQTGKSMEELVNEVDGVGNPKGEVYSRKELKELLKSFDKIDMFAGLLNSWMVFPEWSGLIADQILKPLEEYFGWFLYAKGFKL